MSEIRLAQDADYLLCVLYDAYRDRRKVGEFAEDAVRFGGSEEIQAKYIPEWPTNDIDHAARILNKKGFLDCFFADDVLYGYCAISDDGLTYMENRFTDRLHGFAQHLSTLRTIIFG